MKKVWRSYQLIGQTEQGFTLLEVMLALSVTSLSIFLISFFLEQSESMQNEIKTDRQIEWHLFLNQLEYELKETRLVTVQRERMIVERQTEDGTKEEITYERYYRIFRRKVGGEGHQPVLMQLNSIELTYKTGQLWITAVFQNEETYTARIEIAKESADGEEINE